MQKFPFTEMLMAKKSFVFSAYLQAENKKQAEVFVHTVYTVCDL